MVRFQEGDELVFELYEFLFCCQFYISVLEVYGSILVKFCDELLILVVDGFQYFELVELFYLEFICRVYEYV